MEFYEAGVLMFEFAVSRQEILINFPCKIKLNMINYFSN